MRVLFLTTALVGLSFLVPGCAKDDTTTPDDTTVETEGVTVTTPDATSPGDDADTTE